ncbi:MAG: hypothetical protein N2C14_21000 [Planctomycetales bacterium]
MNILYPNSDTRKFETLDSLGDFTKTNIKQVIDNRYWFAAYADSIQGTLMD